MEVSRGGSSLIRGSYRKPAREGGAHNNENDDEKMVVTQRAECAHSGTRGEDPGDNNHQVSGEDTSHDLPALGPSGHSEPNPRNADDPLQSPVMDLPKCEEAKSVSKVSVATCPKRVLRRPASESQGKIMENEGEKEELRTKMVHLCDETAEYGIQFDRDPTATEIINTINMIKKKIKMKNKKKSKKKKKGTSHSDETNNPNLSKALLSMNADD